MECTCSAGLLRYGALHGHAEGDTAVVIGNKETCMTRSGEAPGMALYMTGDERVR